MKDTTKELANIEESAMSVDKVLLQVNLIQQIMEKVMTKDEHYGTIPGTKKPTLYKPGAEKLCLTFRLDPDYEIIREIREKDFIAYTVKCTLKHIPTGLSIASGIGSCNSREAKYRYRYVDEFTEIPVPKAYWKAKNAGNSKEMKRFLAEAGGGEGFRAAKNEETGQWVLAKGTKVENDNPWDLDNTLVKMACKRGLTAATLNATAASDIFTQDLEDMDDIPGSAKTKEKPKKESKKQTKKEPQKQPEQQPILGENVECDKPESPQHEQTISTKYCAKMCKLKDECDTWQVADAPTEDDIPF